MFPLDMQVTRYLPRPPERHSAFGHLAKAKPAAVPASKSSGSAPKSAGEIKPRAAAPDPATKPARPAEPAPAASVSYNFSHLQGAVMKRGSLDRFTSHLEDTKLTTNDRPRQSSAEVHANDFAAAMEQAMAQAEGRAPRPLLGGPSQEHLEQMMGGDQIVDVLKRRDASRAARRSDRGG